MKRLIINDGERVIPYVDQAIGGREHLPLDSFCIGITDDTGELQGGVVYTSFDGVGVTLHSAGKTRMWLNRMFLKAVFSYPFCQLKCRRLTTIVRADNPHASVVAEKAGFKYEGRLRKAEQDGCDLIIYGMLKEECPWLGEKNG